MEAESLLDMRQHLDCHFSQAVELLLKCQGHIILMGIGKSGHIANKIASTMASTGSPAFFVHPTEAAHGDLGMIGANDIIVVLSHSGESAELLALLPALKRKGLPLIAITGRTNCTLAQVADIHILAKIKQEACPLGLAPTTSTTLSLALGDALAICLLKARHFTSDDFALSHPGGNLGKRLLLHVSEIMLMPPYIPVIQQTACLKDAIITMTKYGLGMTVIVNEQNYVLGIFTDGDLRRLLQQEESIINKPINEIMVHHPKTIAKEHLASEALYQMQQHKITSLVVTDKANYLLGVLTMHQLISAGVA